MNSSVKITEVKAREVLDSRGFPTVEVELHTAAGYTASAIVPSGASTGEYEALELRDGDPKRYMGKGVLKAISNVKEKIAPVIQGREFSQQSVFDDLLREIDGTENKSSLGANAILAVSMAFARAKAQASGKALFQDLASTCGTAGVTLPVPLMNILNGGKHADNGLAIQEFMIVPAGFTSFKEALRAGTEVFHTLKKILHAKKLFTGVGDEGGFAPVLEGEGSHEQVIELLMKAIREAGYKPGQQIYLALDCASSEFSQKTGDGIFYDFEGKKLTSGEMIKIYDQWISKFPIVSIEDGLSEHDWDGWRAMTSQIGHKCQLVGDDLLVTNAKFLKKGIELKASNAILIKLNQIGTVTETLETIRMAKQAGFGVITSHRSGESEDTFIADLAVGTDSGQIKTGSASRTDRLAKYNQLIRIEESLGDRARYLGKGVYKGL